MQYRALNLMIYCLCAFVEQVCCIVQSILLTSQLYLNISRSEIHMFAAFW